jgi:hypothetical protein
MTFGTAIMTPQAVSLLYVKQLISSVNNTNVVGL